MPIQKCITKKGKAGYKYVSSGKCYPGKSGKARAAAQGRAIEASKARKGK